VARSVTKNMKAKKREKADAAEAYARADFQRAADIYQRATVMWDLIEQEALRSLPRTQEQQDEMREITAIAFNERHAVTIRFRKNFAESKKRMIDHLPWHRMGGVMLMRVGTWSQMGHDGEFLETHAYHFVVSHNYKPLYYLDLDGWYLGCKFCNLLLAPEYKNWTEWRIATVRAHTDRCALRYLLTKYNPNTFYLEA
jgi:hypothetical protein